MRDIDPATLRHIKFTRDGDGSYVASYRGISTLQGRGPDRFAALDDLETKVQAFRRVK